MALDTFGDMTPIEAPTTDNSTNGVESSGALDTFENGAVITELPKEEEAKPEEKVAKAKEGKDSQVEQLDDQEEGEKVEEEKKEEPKEEVKEEVKEEPKEEVKLEGKSIRLKEGDKSVDINENATLKVKVKGKNEFVSIADLKKNFSGHQVWDEKIKLADTKLKESEQKAEKFEGQKNAIVSDLRQVVEKMDDAEGNPLDAMKYLLEITGRPVHS
jgi:hypothetical protein